MAVAIDIGDSYDIHPKNKQEVGRRLALAAEGIAYGRKSSTWGRRSSPCARTREPCVCDLPMWREDWWFADRA